MGAVIRAFDALPEIDRAIFTPKDFKTVRNIVHGVAGIVLAPSKAMMVYSRLSPLVRDSRLGTFASYLDHVQKNDEDLRRFICALTTNHTYFFREDHHFSHLGQVVRPALFDKALGGEPVRIWSAGCSSGEETWSILTTLLGGEAETAKDLFASDFRLLATDIDDEVLTAARHARYTDEAMKPLPQPLRRLWTRRERGAVSILPRVQRLAHFKRLNLLGDWPMKRRFDVIFCRNVMIYFDQPSKERLLDRLGQALLPGGFLYIGHSERVSGPAAKMIKQVGNTIYRKDTA